ncbi:fluoride efflux transporter CrcB [Neptunicella marina]|uniref:Fluoride-specific ion channel FluC n=1 Tax=Neptunicella marina TaxID=2125989 RepID=A0A8J6J0P9_9ALTE|nr:fluoride efflux transporter CrcB [Neptunicella marina]MBC3767757.1 fluoride efflux transporter CrcB [Neptunicella marina]
MNNLTIYAYIAVGGASGACLRHFVNQIMIQLLGKGFPFGTLLVNVVGSFLLGFLYSLLEQGHVAVAPWRSLIAIGFLGALTTFSTFSVDSMLLLQQGSWMKALANITLNLVSCFIAAWLGLNLISRQ